MQQEAAKRRKVKIFTDVEKSFNLRKMINRRDETNGVLSFDSYEKTIRCLFQTVRNVFVLFRSQVK